MLTDAEQVLSAAKKLREPVVVWDTRQGSAKSKFLLTNAEIWPAVSEQITRELFNSMKVSGQLEDDPTKRKKIDRFQAWPVKVSP